MNFELVKTINKRELRRKAPALRKGQAHPQERTNHKVHVSNLIIRKRTILICPFFKAIKFPCVYANILLIEKFDVLMTTVFSNHEAHSRLQVNLNNN